MARRIVLYCDSPASGGFEQLVGRLANVLADAGHEVELLYWHEKFAAVADHPRLHKTRLAAPAGVPLPFVRSFDPVAIWRVARELRARHSALIVVCQSSVEIGAHALIAARLAGIPTVSYLAFAFDLRQIGARLGTLRERVNHTFYRLPEQYIALSEFQRELIRARVRVPVHVIPMTIPVEEYREPARRAPRTTLELGVVGVVSFATKGHDVLPDLSAALERRGTNARMHIVGDGPDLPRMRELIAHRGVASRFEIHGAVPYGAPREVMRTLDVLLIPSRFEGAVPLVAFEALAEGIPFVINDLPSTRDWNIPPELRFNRGSPDDIMRAIDAALRFRASPEFEPFRQRMLATVSEDAFASAAREVFAELLATVR